MEDKPMTKVKDLTPASKQVNVLVKVVSLSEEREITSKFGEARKLVEATVGDETGTVLLTLWNDQIGSVLKDETLLIDNGYVTLVRGHIRLNVGKYGTMAKSEQMIENVNAALDVSAVEYEREPRYRSGGYSGERRERSGGGERQFEFGTFSGNRSGGGGGGGGGRDRDRRDRGRRRY
jgi:replication factor A1